MTYLKKVEVVIWLQTHIYKVGILIYLTRAVSPGWVPNIRGAGRLPVRFSGDFGRKEANVLDGRV